MNRKEALKAYPNLCRADLSGADLSGADLSGADLRGAYLSGADLSGADLSGADLGGADLGGANLYGANLYGANLSGANLRGANLYSAKNIPEIILAESSIVPEFGQFIGWKKCRDSIIIKLMIGRKAKRSNATGRKCRAEYVKVLEVIGADLGISQHDGKTEYRKGSIVRCHKWESDRWVECGGGIHFFLTKIEAEQYPDYTSRHGKFMRAKGKTMKTIEVALSPEKEAKRQCILAIADQLEKWSKLDPTAREKFEIASITRVFGWSPEMYVNLGFDEESEKDLNELHEESQVFWLKNS